MAKIFLRGKLQGIEVDDIRGEELKGEWLARKFEKDDVINAGNVAFKASEIKSIEVIPSFNKKKDIRYERMNLSNPEIREKVKNFEKVFLDWLVQNPKMRDNPFCNLQWYQDMGVIRIKESVGNFAIIEGRTKEYEELQDNWTALQTLIVMRKKASEIKYK